MGYEKALFVGFVLYSHEYSLNHMFILYHVCDVVLYVILGFNQYSYYHRRGI